MLEGMVLMNFIRGTMRVLSMSMEEKWLGKG